MIDLLTENSWTQGFFSTDKNGKVVVWNHKSAEKYCLRGAMFYVCDIQRNGSKILDQVERALIEALASEYDWKGGIAPWNDTPGRTSGEVLDLLERVKERC